MTNIEQLDYVFRFFKPFAGEIKSGHDLYLINFFPVAFGKPDNWILKSKTMTPADVARANSGIDLNKDGKITVKEFKRFSQKKFDKANIDPYEK